MTKAKLLKKLDEAIIIEEQAVPVYSDHLKIIFNSDYSRYDCNQI